MKKVSLNLLFYISSFFGEFEIFFKHFHVKMKSSIVCYVDFYEKLRNRQILNVFGWKIQTM